MSDTPFKIGDDVHFEHWSSKPDDVLGPWIVNGTITAIEPPSRFTKNSTVVVDDFYRLDGFTRLSPGFHQKDQNA